jgi:hypothetical protein
MLDSWLLDIDGPGIHLTPFSMIQDARKSFSKSISAGNFLVNYALA